MEENMKSLFAEVMTGREKLWTERSGEEKMEALRRHVTSLLQEIKGLRENLNEHNSDFMKHDHVNGGIMFRPDLRTHTGEIYPRNFYIPTDLRDEE